MSASWSASELVGKSAERGAASSARQDANGPRIVAVVPVASDGRLLREDVAAEVETKLAVGIGARVPRCIGADHAELVRPLAVGADATVAQRLLGEGVGHAAIADVFACETLDGHVGKLAAEDANRLRVVDRDEIHGRVALPIETLPVGGVGLEVVDYLPVGQADGRTALTREERRHLSDINARFLRVVPGFADVEAQ